MSDFEPCPAFLRLACDLPRGHAGAHENRCDGAWHEAAAPSPPPTLDEWKAMALRLGSELQRCQWAADDEVGDCICPCCEAREGAEHEAECSIAGCLSTLRALKERTT